MPIPGYKTATTINLRLWSRYRSPLLSSFLANVWSASRPSTTFNLDQFNKGDYYKAIEQKQAAENITSVLYPNDNTEAGKEVRIPFSGFSNSPMLTLHCAAPLEAAVLLRLSHAG